MKRPSGNRFVTQGFSLIELSIVLAIIGLLVGGVMGGQALVKRGRLTSVMTDLNKYKTAYFKFKERYNALPGDFMDATEHWGSDTGTGCGTPLAADRVPKTATCNGSGDGYIGYSANNFTTPQPLETWRAWQHMANAGFITGSFTGVTGSGNSTDSVPDQNIPAGPFDNSGYAISSPGTAAATTDFPGATYGTMILYGGRVIGDIPYSALLTPAQQWNIDKKIDDGIPATGRVLSFLEGGSLTPNCAVAGNTAYALSTQAASCSVLFIVDPFD